MSDSTSIIEPSENASAPAPNYVVVARRYRPQTFEELIGQEHVGQALSNAISTNRVGHAYLFTGARGVGKTSAARILGKALNCVDGPLPLPCNRCDICQSISSGDDVDVLEIDGASNRGIDEIRQLRQNVNVRPSRARFKIYIIDEVHMLTREAFNALLKTLEEPPGHVKFIFCTTEPTKIPITILSRCQRFDFAGILSDSIARRLKQIVEAEGVEADDEALEVLARRAAGSMRDSQSLLEQLLAFAPGRITLDDVHGMLGTAGDQRLAAMAGHLVDRNAAAVLAELDGAVNEGVDVALLLEQLFGYFRDCTAAAVGCPAESFLYASSGSRAQVSELGNRLGLASLLAVMQILEQTLSRLRYSTQGRILAELALVRICCLEELDELRELIAELRSGVAVADPPGASGKVAARSPAKPPAERNPRTAPPPPSSAGATPAKPAPQTLEITPENAVEIWNRVLSKMSGMVVDQAKEFDQVTLDEPGHLVVTFKPMYYDLAKSRLERPEVLSQFQRALAEVTGARVRVSFAVSEEESGEAPPAAASAPRSSPQQRLLEIAKHPMVHRAGELFGAEPTKVDPPN
ncbi:MAG TPA: DNA polymerase III subunit gamma/tau [Thermoguttaceae bacterium]|nr:DNA polymerase III subunit gamma/tau [Thermoguttaceae bacterium]